MIIYVVHGGAVSGASDMGGSGGIPEALATDSDFCGDGTSSDDGCSSGPACWNGNGLRT